MIFVRVDAVVVVVVVVVHSSILCVDKRLKKKVTC